MQDTYQIIKQLEDIKKNLPNVFQNYRQPTSFGITENEKEISLILKILDMKTKNFMEQEINKIIIELTEKHKLL